MLTFYDALETDDSAVKVIGDETLHKIARELVQTVRNKVTIDWTLREHVRAQLRVLVKRIPRKYGYPPDKQGKATQTVLEQAELLTAESVAAWVRRTACTEAEQPDAPGRAKNEAVQISARSALHSGIRINQSLPQRDGAHLSQMPDRDSCGGRWRSTRSAPRPMKAGPSLQGRRLIESRANRYERPGIATRRRLACPRIGRHAVVVSRGPRARCRDDLETGGRGCTLGLGLGKGTLGCGTAHLGTNAIGTRRDMAGDPGGRQSDR